MLMIIPKEIEDKVTYTYMDVKVIEGCTLTPEEEKIFQEFRIRLKEANEDRFR